MKKLRDLIPEKGSDMLDVEIDLDVNFNEVYHVYVIRNLYKVEQETLERNLFDRGPDV